MSKVVHVPYTHSWPCWCGAESVQVADEDGRVTGLTVMHNDAIGAAMQTRPLGLLWYTPREQLL